jgi:hypothetical protein
MVMRSRATDSRSESKCQEKMTKSVTQTTVRASHGAGKTIHTSRQSCSKAEKEQKFVTSLQDGHTDGNCR